MNLKQELSRRIDSFENDAVEMLEALIAFPSVQGEEKGVQDFILSDFRKLGLAAASVAIEDSIMQDPEYAFSDHPASYRDRCNVVNAHSDLVPA